MLKIRKFKNNPILGPNPDLPWGRDEARNPGVIFDGSMFHMVFTASTDIMGGGDMVLGYAQSTDGVNFKCAAESFLRPSKNPEDFDHGSVEDCRITELDGQYYIAYAGRSLNIKDFNNGVRRLGPGKNINPTWTDNFRRVGLAVTRDWKQVNRLGPITSEHMSNANVALFPEKIKGKYVILHRPTPFIPWTLPLIYNPGCMWIAFSDSLLHWSSNRREMPWNMKDGIDIPDDQLLIRPEHDWEKLKVGGSGVPIPTDDGWLTFYHAVDRDGVYRVGLMLLDREDPGKVIARSDRPVMEPEESYELNGLYPKCIFPCANVVVDNEIFIYYGAVDLYCGLATLNLKEALDYVLQFRRKNKISSSWTEEKKLEEVLA
jgi:predicted GH43/DUF377 family glycosyl hydrolase